ncbi:hypothetical protein D3H35_14155 [Cohnella faecalis]|uniref:Uncharacterized protein n=1 Tax=Cohnella faecalis TaxID=2315694 RepID=A0A398CM84_9BACL|nr:hypothetical protein D3H35_14155 [Cohnella faecalis]
MVQRTGNENPYSSANSRADFCAVGAVRLMAMYGQFFFSIVQLTISELRPCKTGTRTAKNSDGGLAAGMPPLNKAAIDPGEGESDGAR